MNVSRIFVLLDPHLHHFWDAAIGLTDKDKTFCPIGLRLGHKEGSVKILHSEPKIITIQKGAIHAIYHFNFRDRHKDYLAYKFELLNAISIQNL